MRRCIRILLSGIATALLHGIGQNTKPEGGHNLAPAQGNGREKERSNLWRKYKEVESKALATQIYRNHANISGPAVKAHTQVREEEKKEA